MLTIYSPVQRTHRPAYVVKQGERSASFDVPERVDSILSAINEQELGPVKGFGTAPDAVGDILGSTAKGATPDCIWGLYREPGKDLNKLRHPMRWACPTGRSPKVPN